jgi:hypothetical protein
VAAEGVLVGDRVPRQGHCPLLLRTGGPRLQWQQLFSLVLPAPVERRALREILLSAHFWIGAAK